MSILQALDATRIASRQSAALADPAAWAVPAPVGPRPRAAFAPEGSYSWWTLARNPRAALLSAMVATVVAGDALLGRS